MRANFNSTRRLAMTSIPRRTFVGGALSLLAGCTAPRMAQDDAPRKPLVLMTGAAGGTFVEYGNGLARLLTAAGVPVATRESGGSLDNLRALSAGGCDLALVAMASAYEAWHGLRWAQGAPLRGYSALLPMYETPFHLATTAAGGLTRFDQLAGRRVGVGPRGGANEQIFVELSAHLKPGCELAYGTPSEMAAGVVAGRLDAFFFGAGAPVPAYQEIAAKSRILFLPIEGQALANARRAFPYLTVTRLPAGSYVGQDHAVPTLGLWNFVLAADSLPAATAARIARAVLERSDLAQALHPTAVQTRAANYAANTFLPLHPGATVAAR
jgi:TRAP transporter TAXI family solute receptor